MSEREDVLVIRVTRPAGLDFKALNQYEAAAKGERYAAMQEVEIETTDSFVEEFADAWDRVAAIAVDVRAGRRNLAGESRPVVPVAQEEEERDG